MKHAQVILLIDQEMDAHTIELITAYTQKYAYKLRRQYLQVGIEAITDKRTPKPKELLTRNQREQIIETIKTKNPKELGSYYQNYEYWTAGVLGEYIKRTYQVEYKSNTSHYLLFRRARFTYHKPGRVSARRDAQEVKEWRIKARKRIERAMA